MPTTKPLTARIIELSRDSLKLVLNDGREIAIPWAKCSKRLAKASEKERLHAELSPGGYGIHWPLIDEDLSIGGLASVASLQ